jgi:hypothetical protein
MKKNGKKMTKGLRMGEECVAKKLPDDIEEGI